MTTVAPATTSYVRGAPPSALGRPLRTTLAAAGLATIVAFAAVLVVQAYQQNARQDRLVSSGVPVLARVTDCYAIASGTGITATGVVCHATFTLDGQSHAATLRGNTAYHRPGDVVRAVTTPGRPSDLTVGRLHRGSWTSFLLPAGLLLSCVLGFALRSRRRKKSGKNSPKPALIACLPR